MKAQLESSICRNLYRKGVNAKQIWEKGKIKNELAESIGIKLIRSEEYDWVNDNENVKKPGINPGFLFNQFLTFLVDRML